MTPERREDGWDELRRLVDDHIFDLPIGDDVTYSRGYSAGIAAARESLRAAIVDRLAAATPPPEPAIDVERLARAIERAGVTYPADRLADPYFFETAEDIIREYDRLGSE